MKSVRVVISTIAVVIALACGLALGVFGRDLLPQFSGVETVSENRSSEIITSLTEEEQVVLLSLGIQGIENNVSSGSVGGFTIPGSDKTTYIPYSFTAKLGVDGQSVKIREINEHTFEVTIPEFIFIGHDDISFDSAIVTGGLIKWIAPEGDQMEMANNILGADQKVQYVDRYRDVLQEQAEHFYTKIVRSVDPNVVLEFRFGNAD